MRSLATMRRFPERESFIKWQCRVRQHAMRQHRGRPDEAVRPQVVLPGQGGSVGPISTVLNREPEHSMTPELEHIAARTHDPAERLEQAVRFLCAGYYQAHREFSDILTATFVSGSATAARILAADGCVVLHFDAYGQRFDIFCCARRLAKDNPLHQSTLAHNRLFNPLQPPDIEVLGFEPDWAGSNSGSKAA